MSTESVVKAPLNATFFTLQHRDRAVLLPATLVFLAIVVLLVGALIAINWGGISRLLDLAQHPLPKGSEQAAISFISSIFLLVGSVFLMLFPFYLAAAAYETACLRWMIRGETPGFFGLTLDHDTWRVYGVYWCWVIAQFAISFALSIIMIPVMFATMGDILAGGKPDPDAMWRWQMSVQMPLSLLQYIPLAFIGIRFGPAAATSVARRRFSFLEAWKVTEGRFLSLLGSYALLWLVFAIVGVLIFVACFGSLFHDVGWDWIANWRKPPSEASALALFTRLFSVQGLTAYALTAAFNLVPFLAYVLLSYGINARAALAALEEGKIAPVAD